MPCEVKRHGRLNEEVQRRDGYNNDAPSFFSNLGGGRNRRQNNNNLRAPSKPASAYFTVEEDQKRFKDDELMPCEVKRHGRLNEEVQRRDGYNNDAPPLGTPIRQTRPKSPMRGGGGGGGSSSGYLNNMFQQQNDSTGITNDVRGGGRVNSFQDAIAAPAADYPSVSPPSYAGRAPPVGLFSKTNVIELDFPSPSPAPELSGAPTVANVSPPSPDDSYSPSRASYAGRAPPVGLFSKTNVIELDFPSPSPPPLEAPNSGSVGIGSANYAGGAPPVGMFQNNNNMHVSEPLMSTGFSSPAASPSITNNAMSRQSLSQMRPVQQLQEIRRRYMSDVRSSLVLLNTVLFVYQVTTTIFFLAGRRASVIWPDALTGGAGIAGQPLLRDWLFTERLAKWQPHRYITAGFTHFGLLHLVLNLDILRSLPSNLERTVGSSVYGTTFMLASVAGHVGHATWSGVGSVAGAGGGIAGIYGMLAVYELLRVKNNAQGQRQVALSVGKGIGRQLLYGLCLPQMFSNMAQMSGFLAGVGSGLLFALTSPKGSPSEVGEPAKRNTTVLAVWVIALSAILFVPNLRAVPLMILKSLMQPGSLTAGRGRFQLN